MSKAIKSVAKIALPIAAAYFAPGIGAALGFTGTTAAAVGGAVGGGVGGAISGGGVKGILKGAALGGVGGYLGNGGAGELFGGTQVGDLLGIENPATAGYNATGLPSNNIPTGAGAPVGTAATGGARSIGSLGNALTVGNALTTANSYNAADEAAKIQSEAVDKAASVQAPYNALGTNAAAQIQQIQSDPGAYVQNNPFYKSLADDAEQRLLANQAAKGKLASGGTQDALQTSLLNLGNGLVQQQVGTLQNQVNSGQSAANTTSGLLTSQGAVQAGGVAGQAQALSTGYQNQISTLLALQNLNKAPSYQPTQPVRG